MISIVLLFFGVVYSDYCSEGGAPPVVPAEVEKCFTTEFATMSTPESDFCTALWNRATTNADGTGYEWAKAESYQKGCKDRQICCEVKNLTASGCTLIGCTMNKACAWLIPNLPWFLPVIIGIVGLAVLACIISCCCGCCGNSSKTKKPKKEEDDAAAAALAAQQQQLVALQAATSMALMTQQQLALANSPAGAAPTETAPSATPAADPYASAPATDPYASAPAADPYASTDPDPFAAKPEYSDSEPGAEPPIVDFAGF